jgi:hypothetical protein
MRDMGTPHQRMQELCNCYTETDFLKEMARIEGDSDKDEAALKWLALAVLYGVDREAKKISLERSADGGIQVVAKYRDSTLPDPGREIGGKVIEAVRGITHIDGKKGEIPLAIGIRDSNLQIRIQVKEEGGKEKITLEF